MSVHTILSLIGPFVGWFKYNILVFVPVQIGGLELQIPSLHFNILRPNIRYPGLHSK